MSVKLALRRAKWHVKATIEGGSRDFRRIGLAVIESFAGSDGTLAFRGWAHSFKPLAQAPRIELLDGDAVVFSGAVDETTSQSALDYLQLPGSLASGIDFFAHYRASRDLEARLLFETAAGAYYLALGQVAANCDGAAAAEVALPRAEGQIGDISVGYAYLGAQHEQTGRASRSGQANSASFPDADAVDARKLEPYASALESISLIGPCILALSHDQGGGASSFLECAMENDLDDSTPFALASYCADDGKFHLNVTASGRQFQLKAQSLEAILSLFPHPKAIWINELVSFPDTDNALEAIGGHVAAHGIPCTLFIHDYFSVCPSIFLMGIEPFSCNLEWPAEKCRRCYEAMGFEHRGFAGSIEEYRAHWKKLFEVCTEVRCFSKSSEELMRTAYPELASITVKPHVIEPLDTVDLHAYRHAGTNIGFLGVMCEHKGSKVVNAIMNENSDESVRFVNIGPIAGAHFDKPLKSTGPYERDEISQLIAAEEIDVFFLSSVCPETYSYTCSEIISTGVPIASFDIGAPAQRIASYEKGLVIPRTASSSEILDSLVGLASQHRSQR